MTMLVITGKACAPIAAIVATSPADPPAPLGSLTLKLITQAGEGCSVWLSASPSAVGRVGDWAVIGRCSEGPEESRSKEAGRPLAEREECCVCTYTALLFTGGTCLQSR